MSNTDNILLNNRKAFTSRQSMDSLIAFARQQDDKIYSRRKRFNHARIFSLLTMFAVPFVYAAHSFIIGYWRNIYHTSLLTTAFEARPGHYREYFVPEMYLKEREVRKIELGLKDTEELRALYKKEEEA